MLLEAEGLAMPLEMEREGLKMGPQAFSQLAPNPTQCWGSLACL